MQKEQKIARIHQPIHLTLSRDTIHLLKNTGNNASKVIDTLIKDAFLESKPVRVIIGESGWARGDSNPRPPPCEGDVTGSVSRAEPKSAEVGGVLAEDRIPGEEAPDTLNTTYKQHRAAFHRWLEAKVSGGKLEARTANDYKAGVKSLFTDHEIRKPSDSDAVDFGDKQSRGLRNFFNYLEDEEIQKVAGYSLPTWRRKVQIKKSGKDRTFPTTEEVIEAWKHMKDNEVTIFKLLAYSGCRFSHGYNILKKANLLKYEMKGDIAYINTESLTKHTKQSFVMFFPASFVKELQDFNPSMLGNPSNLKRSLQHGNVSAKTIRKWHFNLMRKRARIDSAVANFLHGRGQSNVGDDVLS